MSLRMSSRTPDAAFAGLRLAGYSAGYGSKQVLSDLHVEVGSGESVALLGPNGAGKTTFLNSIVGGTRVFAGRVLVGEEDVTGLAPERFVSRGIAIVPQTGGVFGELTVAENLRLARLASGRDPRGEIEAEVLRNPILAPIAQRRAATLSGGQRQMLAIGRALCCRPDLLLLDEPSIGLAPQAVDAVVEAIEAARERYALSVLLAEQHVQAAIALCSRYYLLKAGAISRSGPVDADLADVIGAEYLM